MSLVVEDTKGKIRDLPIQKKLREILTDAARQVGLSEVRVTAGGQCAKGTCSKRKGSTRHDLGWAADLEIWKDGKALDFTDLQELPVFEAFVAAVAKLGATGIGAGVGYMGPRTIHVGFGEKHVWGAKGFSSNAPEWLRAAALKGWSDAAARAARTFSVAARNGVRLRGGPGIEFGVISTIDAGTVLSVDHFDGPNQDWARVDLQGDGLYDGHIHRSFLSEVDNVLEDNGEEQDDCSEDVSSESKKVRTRK